MNLTEFRLAVSDSFVPLEVTTDLEDFSATLKQAKIGSVAFVSVHADRHVVRRTESLINSSPRSFFKISLQCQGSSTMQQGGREVVTHPGDIVVYDTTKPYTLTFTEPFSVMVIQLPHDKIRIPSSLHDSVVATRLGADQGLGRVVSPFLMSLASNMEELSGPAGSSLAKNAIEMLESLIVNELDVSRTIADPHYSLLRQVHDYVDQNLGSPELNPTSIAEAVHISTRHLYSLLSDQGTTVSTYIRSRRLEKCYLDLTNPAKADMSVGAIGTTWGFPDAAHFSRTFKNVYGVTPVEARKGRQ